ncbi:ubiquitin-specific protease OTU1 [Aspergillus clavatus NRRL 1]|uniref:Ubiquitin thioesterase OTU n=1 Tax=Aspergillus clavatus (strain ATCC 1007 / CBS 513.65 / DSM 816 / NCTC 3887 / NRRL 1 / QM 1276 / 107) TaxID=344612 RepID=A1CJ29_ASPCL|nr:OTU-like cysteine protease, putative [Aspergillus clavatus NRRL 1]EAW09153.1 OTU-like cysteine protease, putative [Aspergillus clavatus NRRL 1]
MRIRIRGPTGQSTVTLDDTATINDLRVKIVEKTGLTAYDVKYGYPGLKSLDLDALQSDEKIKDISVNLNGEQLLITRKEDSAPPPPTQAPNEEVPQKLSLSRKSHEGISDDPPEIPSTEHSGTFVLRIMPDDNSCLFRAVGSAIMGGMDTMNELRSIVAQTIQANPDIYSEAVLEKKPDDYCRWIQNEDSWGGAIELSILSKHFDIEICSIDVQTLRVDRFNEGPGTRCILVYSGIHYDTIALSPSDPPYTHAYAPPEFDTKVFDAADPLVLEKSRALCQVLQNKHYYTDTAGFRIRCNTCGGIFVGEKGATQHATQTGHYDFGEAG